MSTNTETVQVKIKEQIDLNDFKNLMRKHSLTITKEIPTKHGMIFNLSASVEDLDPNETITDHVEAILVETHMNWEFA